MIDINEVINNLKTEYHQNDGMLILILMSGITTIQETHKSTLKQFPGFEHMINYNLDKMYEYLQEVSGYEF